MSNWGSGDREFSLILENNPLLDLVEVPPHLNSLIYSQIIAGAIRGALEALHFKVRGLFEELFRKFAGFQLLSSARYNDKLGDYGLSNKQNIDIP